MKAIVASVSVAVALALVAVTSPAQAAPQGEVVVERLVQRATSSKCADYWVQATNASDSPVTSVKLLMYAATDDDFTRFVPYKRTKKRSWVSWPMYLKPGKTIKGTMEICATVNMQPAAAKYATFAHKKVKWTWAK